MNGIIIIDKPQGFTSQDVVSKTKKILNIKKAGHTGTLDPLATGVLPVLLGNYTKFSKYLIEHNKTYVATLKLGKKSETGDSEGKVVEEKEVLDRCFEKKFVNDILNKFKGKQMQTPPMYSAIKINGNKLYEYARKGEKVEIPQREIEIFNINLLEIKKEQKEIKFEVTCSKGTYIRVLCEDIAEKMETVGFMSDLRRTEVDKFTLENAVTFEILEENKNNIKFLNSHIFNIENVFSNLENIHLNIRKEELFLNGVLLTFELQDGIYNIYDSKNSYMGLGTVKSKLLKRDIIIKE